MRHSLSAVRTRWAAIGAAVAITLGGGGLWIAEAAGDSDPSTFRSITPCRLADFRPSDNVGPKVSPLGPGETYTVDATGPSGNCALPASATAIVANVTAVGATQPTFVTLFPADATRPLSANLNPAPGEPPTPNLVTVGLDTDGEFSMFNRNGSVDLVIDVMGYYEVANFDDRYAGRTVTDAISLVGAVTANGTAPNTVDGCLYDGSVPYQLIIPVSLPVGATVTGFRTDIRSGAASLNEFGLFLRKRFLDGTGSSELTMAGVVGASAINLPVVERKSYVPGIAGDGVIGDGDYAYISFEHGSSDDHAICSAQVTYTLPPAAD